VRADVSVILYVSSRTRRRNVALISSTDKEFCERFTKWAEADGYMVASEIPPEIATGGFVRTTIVESVESVESQTRLVHRGRKERSLAVFVRRIRAYLLRK